MFFYVLNVDGGRWPFVRCSWSSLSDTARGKLYLRSHLRLFLFPGARRSHLRCTVFASLLARGLREGGSLRKACARVARAFACARLARSSLFEACARFARAFACARLFARRSSREPCARLALREADIGQTHMVGRMINLQHK